MLEIYSQTFTTATRIGMVSVRDVKAPSKKKRWLLKGHWFLSSPRSIDPNRL